MENIAIIILTSVIIAIALLTFKAAWQESQARKHEANRFKPDNH